MASINENFDSLCTTNHSLSKSKSFFFVLFSIRHTFIIVLTLLQISQVLCAAISKILLLIFVLLKHLIPSYQIVLRKVQ